MYVCVCQAVTERQLRAAIEAGATSLDALATATGAGTGCGCCHESIRAELAHCCGASAGHRCEPDAFAREASRSVPML